MASYTTSTGLVTVSTTPDIRLFYSVSPALPLDPSRPTVIVANSLTASTVFWDEFTAEFAPSDYNVIRYDARFHGQSPLSKTAGFAYPTSTTIDDLADDVVAVLDHVVGPGRRIHAFIGVSVGGGIGVSLAARYPDRFDRFVIVGSHAKIGEAGIALFDQRAAVFREVGGLQKQARAIVKHWFGDAWIQAHPERAGQLTVAVQQTTLDGFLASTGALAKLDLFPHAEAIRKAGTGPRILFVAGEQDAPVLEGNRALVEATGAQPLVLVPNAGHITNVHQPAAFNKLVRDWLATETPAKATI